MFSGTASKFAFLIPLLQPEYVARKIVEAVKTEQVVLWMPKIAYFVLPLSRLLPTAWYDFFLDIMGSTSSMKTFKGRGIDWAMK